MKKITILLLALSITLFSKSTDIYFGNGIMTKFEDAETAARELKIQLKEYLPANLYSQINSVTNHYNSTHLKGAHDLIESAYQKLSLANLLDKIRETAHSVDLGLQINAYRQTVLDGHKVLLIAHSQGNLFGFEAYDSLTQEEKDNFDAISVASPAHRYIIDDRDSHNPFISWDSDVVAHLGLYGTALTTCPVRKVSWDDAHPAAAGMKPDSKYLYKSDLEKLYNHKWKGEEKIGPLKWGIDVHSFGFYMGEPLKDIFTGEVFIDPFSNKPFQSNVAKDFILNNIKSILGKTSGDDTNTTGGGSGTGTGTGSETGTFDYKTKCQGLKLPDDLSMIESQIDEIIANDSGKTIEQICQDIQDIIDTLGGGLPSGSDTPSIS